MARVSHAEAYVADSVWCVVCGMALWCHSEPFGAMGPFRAMGPFGAIWSDGAIWSHLEPFGMRT